MSVTHVSPVGKARLRTPFVVAAPPTVQLCCVAARHAVASPPPSLPAPAPPTPVRRSSEQHQHECRGEDRAFCFVWQDACLTTFDLFFKKEELADSEWVAQCEAAEDELQQVSKGNLLWLWLVCLLLYCTKINFIC